VSDLKPADALKQHLAPTPLGPPASPPATLLDAAHNANKGWRSRGYLPHCDATGLIQHIVFGLADALPKSAAPPSAMHGDQLLDAGYGECLLRRSECAAIVEHTLLHADSERYRLLAWCVMPNHVHVVVEQFEGTPLDAVVQAWKSTSAHRINHLLARKGRLWRREYFDRFMRDDDHLAATIDYVENNPVAAKLATDACAWNWSSARLRQRPVAGEDAGGPRGQA
jgi:putative transposase